MPTYATTLASCATFEPFLPDIATPSVEPSSASSRISSAASSDQVCASKASRDARVLRDDVGTRRASDIHLRTGGPARRTSRHLASRSALTTSSRSGAHRAGPANWIHYGERPKPHPAVEDMRLALFAREPIERGIPSVVLTFTANDLYE